MMLGSEIWEPPSVEIANAFYNFSDRYDQTFFQEFEARHISKLERVGGRWLEPGDIANFVIDKIEQGKPSSLVRLSDGEGNAIMLPQPFGADQALIDWCVNRISYIHFGDHDVILSARKFFADITSNAFQNADVIGFAPFGSVINKFDDPDAKKDVRAICGNRASLLYLRQRLSDNTPVNGASAWFSRGLLPHYRRILQAASRICVISTYDTLAPKLAHAFEIEESRFSHIQVPVQAVFVKTSDRKDTRHYPDAMEKILESISKVEQPTLFLVAAGLLGKHYCETVRSSGGIAIDIGSVAEVWLGIQARGMDSNFIEKWKL